MPEANRPSVLTEVDGDVWRITLDRPETGNALTPALAAELAGEVAEEAGVVDPGPGHDREQVAD